MLAKSLVPLMLVFGSLIMEWETIVPVFISGLILEQTLWATILGKSTKLYSDAVWLRLEMLEGGRSELAID